jgi:hypothetical protein
VNSGRGVLASETAVRAEIAMRLWEFSLICSDGTVTDQSAVAPGANELEAAASVLEEIGSESGAMISRPGRVVPAALEAKWREICNRDAFPVVVSNSGRFDRYVRGLPP